MGDKFDGMNLQATTADNDALTRKRQRSPETSTTGHTIEDATSLSSKRPKLFRIDTSSEALLARVVAQGDSPSSLFSLSEVDSLYDGLDDIDAASPTAIQDSFMSMRTAPPIPGLFFHPSILVPEALAKLVMDFCMNTYFTTSGSNQVMLFGRFLPTSSASSNSGFPKVLLELLDALASLLKEAVPSSTYDLLFPINPTMARQAIINLYQPGEGITPHVDLLGRYADGIIGVSFSSGCSMRFDRVQSADEDGGQSPRFDVHLPERSVIVLSQDARYKWTHGIEKKLADLVQKQPEDETGKGDWVSRRVRMSVTFRWLLPGADVVGDDEQ